MKNLFLFPLFIGGIAFAQITDTGDKVGIGTTNPSQKLDVNGNINAVGKGYFNNGLLVPNNKHFRSRNSSGVEGVVMFVGGDNSVISGDYLNVFGDYRIFSGGNERIRVKKSTGNVGIGTNSPQAKLDIYGQVDGDFNGLIIDNRKNYGANSGVNETSRILLSLSENGTPNPLNRVFGIMEAGTLSETDSSNGRLSFLVRQNGNVSEKMRIMSNGDIGIGTTDTQGFKLGVDGRIAATEVKVATYNNWPDYVFNETYNLPALEEVEQHIEDKGHLKDIPSAEEVEKDGFFLGEMDSKLLQKVEELTLYLIQQNKQIEELKNRIKELENK